MATKAPKNLCTIDPRVKDQYIYQPEKERWVSVGLATIMQEMHLFRVQQGHDPQNGKRRHIYAHEFKSVRSN